MNKIIELDTINPTLIKILNNPHHQIWLSNSVMKKFSEGKKFNPINKNNINVLASKILSINTVAKPTEKDIFSFWNK